MENLVYCTLTGIDDSVNLDAVKDLFDEFNFVEFGVLWNPNKLGIGRYPSLKTIEEFASRFEGMNIALHACRGAASSLLENQDVPDFVSAFSRIQVNFAFNPVLAWADKFENLLHTYRDQSIITQHNQPNLNFSTLFPNRNHEVLFDSSGGRGLTPKGWLPPLRGYLCGYAGGLGAHNVLEELQKIKAVTKDEPFWIDMETSLRTDDRFDLKKCRSVLRLL
jgi:hypothetical protein